MRQTQPTAFRSIKKTKFPKKNDFILHRDGNPLTERQYAILWNALQDELIGHGLHERFTAHQLRHTYATIAANSGEIPTKVLQNMMGHANFQTTMNIYAGRDEFQMVESSCELGMKYAPIAAKSCRKIVHLKVPDTAAAQDLRSFWKHLFRTKSCRKCPFHAFGTNKKSPPQQ